MRLIDIIKDRLRKAVGPYVMHEIAPFGQREGWGGLTHPDTARA